MQREGEYPIVVYERAHPRAFRISRSTGKPKYLRKERRDGWRATLPLYVLWCGDCAIYTVTHPAGYGRIHCSRCRRKERVMTWARFRDKTSVRVLYALAAILLLLSLYLFR